MAASMRVWAMLVVCLLASCSCGDDTPLSVEPDAGEAPSDGGAPSADAGAYEPDAAVSGPDAGAPDAGFLDGDGGSTGFDGGDADGGELTLDGGVTGSDGADAGEADAGPVTAVPDPERVAPTLPTRVVPTFAERNAFLVTGSGQLQIGEITGALKEDRLAVLRGVVLDAGGVGVEGARVSVPAYPDWGWTLTRADGRFDLSVNGGGTVMVEVAAEGFLRAQRAVRPSWNEYKGVDEIVLRELDTHATTLNLLNAPAMAIATGSSVTDSRGTRTGHLLVPAGTTANVVMPDGTSAQVGALTVRVTEYTQGAVDPKTMPASLPPSSAFTYAAEFSADEADVMGAASVTFSRPLFHYVENFLGFAVGKRVPTGYYDRARGVWVPSEDGRVVKVLSEAAGAAVLDTDGDGLADDAATHAALGVTAEELVNVAALYSPGQTLWRVPVPHFTPYDCNWPWRYPSDAARPEDRDAAVESESSSPESRERCPPEEGSVISCEDRSLGEEIGLTGTPMRLHYRSDRQAAYDRASLAIRLASGPLPSSLERIELQVAVAGRTTLRTYAPSGPMTDRFSWDGLDAYGRALSGTQLVSAEIRYWYPGVYLEAENRSRGFGSLPEVNASIVAATGSGMSLAWVRRFSVPVTKRLGFWDDLGGWSLTPHHAYDPGARRLYRGDGDARDVDGASASIRTAAGRGNTSGTGTLATQVGLSSPSGLAVMPDGSFYLTANVLNGLRHVDTTGRMTTIVPVANPGDPCDGWGGTADHIAYDGRGSLYFTRDAYTSGTTGGWGLVCRLDLATLKVWRVLGTKTAESSACQVGDAASVVLGDQLHGVAVGPDGSVYFSDDTGDCVRRLLTDGTVERILGGGTRSPSSSADPRDIRITDPQGIDVTPDGVVYVAGYGDGRLYRIDPDANLTIIAGPGATAPAPTTALSQPRNVRVSPEGFVYVSEWSAHRVRRIAPDGTTDVVAGGGTGFTELASPHEVAVTRPMSIVFLPGHTEAAPQFLLAGQGTSSTAGHRIYRIARPSLAYADGEILVPDGERLELYVFDANGRHLETRHLGTQARLWSFGYDGAGRLVTLTDRDGNVTTLSRDAAGRLQSVDGPYGATTRVTLDGSGRLLSVQSPASRTTTLSYDAAGLLTSLTRPDGTQHRYTYDAAGRLATDTLPSGGVIRLAETRTDVDREVAFSAPSGERTLFLWQPSPSGGGRRTVTFPTGATRVTEYASGGARLGSLEDGSIEETTYGPDPRFGLLMPFIAEHKVTSAAGRVERAGLSRTVTLVNTNDLLAYATWKDERTRDGAGVGSDAWDAAARTRTFVAEDLSATVASWDPSGRLSGVRRDAQGLSAIEYAYDARGRMASARDTSGMWTYAYDASGRLATRTSPAGGVTTLSYDADDRLSSVAYPDGTSSRFLLDALGQPASLIGPAGASHVLAFRADRRLASYTPPGGGALVRSYDADGRWTRTTHPSGRTVSVARAADGRVTSITHGDATTTFQYAGSLLDRPTQMEVTPADASLQPVGLAHVMDGRRVTAVTTTGPAASTVTHAFDSRGRLASRTVVAGTETVNRSYTYVAGRLAGDGRLAFSYGASGQLVSIVDGSSMSASMTYDDHGRLVRRELRVGGTTRHLLELGYTVGGHASTRTETLEGTTRSQAFGYGARGMLAMVTDGGATSESYAYDANGNRTRAGTEFATYDAQDRLLSRGTTAYGYDADGMLLARGADRFAYDARGELLSATVGGATVRYQYDAFLRRVARHDASGTTQYHYAEPGNPYRLSGWRAPGQPLAWIRYDAAGRAVMLEQGGTVQFIATDHLGSPRAFFSPSGALLRELRYDAFGRRTYDSATGTSMPLGFAAGLHDEATGLVRLGVRDYEPVSGRWTTRDPVLFAAQRLNLYAYVGNDPLSLIDPLGLFAVEVGFFAGLGGGVKVAFTDEGWSLCAEGGVGLGETIGVSDAGLDDTGYSVTGEIGVDCFLAGVTGGLDITAPCGDLEFNPKVEASLLGQKWEFKPGTDEVKAQKAGTPEFDEAGKLKCGMGGKLVFKGCGQFSY